MYSCKEILILFFILQTFIIIEARLNELEQLKSIALANGITSEYVSKNQIKVLFNTNEYEIYSYKFEDSNLQLNNDDATFYNMYVSINCQIAEWTKDNIFKLIEHLPSIYHSHFSQLDNTVFVNHFTKFSKTDYETLKINIKRFINILLKYIQIYQQNTYDIFLNTSVLKTLLSSLFKMEFIEKHLNNEPSNEISDTFISQMILEVLNSFQHFMLLNCKMNFDYENKQFFGLFVNSSSQQNIEDFFNDINFLNMESNEECNADEMVLGKEITEAFSNTLWITKKSSTIKIDQAIEKIQSEHNIQAIVWYQKYMFDTIIKFLFTRIVIYYETHRNISTNILKHISEIYQDGLKNISNLSEDLEKCFSIIRDEQVNEQKIVFLTAINFHLNSLHYIYIENVTGVSNLENFIKVLYDNRKQLKCFFRLYEFLNSEMDKHNGPFYNMSEKVSLFMQPLVENSSQNQIVNHEPIASSQIINQEKILLQDFGCGFFTNLYHMSFESIIYLNMSLNENFVLDINVWFYKYTHSLIFNVIKSLSEFSKVTDHFPFHEVISNSLIILDTIKNNVVYDYNDLIRLIYFVMTEFNRYGINNCKPPKYNFLLFNNMSFDRIGAINSYVDTKIANALDGTKFSDEYKNYEYKSMNQILETFNEFNMNHYDSAILFNWRGEKKPLGYINNYFLNAFGELNQLYSFYIIYLKFTFAALFIEVKQFYENPQNENNIHDKLNVDKLLPISFVKNLHYMGNLGTIAESIHRFCKYYLDGKPMKTRIDQLNINIINLFIYEGIYLDFTKSISLLSKDYELQAFKDFDDTNKNLDVLNKFSQSIDDKFYATFMFEFIPKDIRYIV